MKLGNNFPPARFWPSRYPPPREEMDLQALEVLCDYLCDHPHQALIALETLRHGVCGLDSIFWPDYTLPFGEDRDWGRVRFHAAYELTPEARAARKLALQVFSPQYSNHQARPIMSRVPVVVRTHDYWHLWGEGHLQRVASVAHPRSQTSVAQPFVVLKGVAQLTPLNELAAVFQEKGWILVDGNQSWKLRTQPLSQRALRSYLLDLYELPDDAHKKQRRPSDGDPEGEDRDQPPSAGVEVAA